ncbi:YlxR family protein [Protaetiibacter mangrovi]|uniref:YlxR family protein n=1 Tax=Protaetiibacter mangrovi TaxID=2970926 RepID=A0ABT1ZJ46_9MICO|nr:YlxR family protein [Protaetiibacter mangrovi]MCS0500747.1 YlxR family protein [Protaetiibacter mangrovi]TPX02788.1 YlxR family protein [Schumannella luteola]
MESVRTCLGCRQRAPRTSLVRVVARDGRVAVDTAAELPGRGAWVHPDPGCVASAIRRRAFGRALRHDGPLETGELTNLYPDPEEQAERHMDN